MDRYRCLNVMETRTLKVVLTGAALAVLIAVGVMWIVRANAPLGPRPGVDIPLRGM